MKNSTTAFPAKKETRKLKESCTRPYKSVYVEMNEVYGRLFDGERHQQRLLRVPWWDPRFMGLETKCMCMATSAVAILATLTPTVPALPHSPDTRPQVRTVHD